MTRPGIFLTRMVLFLLAVIALAALLNQPLLEAFRANRFLNGFIVLILLFGILFTFRQVISLQPEVRWIETFQTRETTLAQPTTPVLLAPMATMLGDLHGRMTLSTLALRSILDSISLRLDESREIGRYLIGLLIFMGLLGTFWGLLETVTAVGGTISGLSLGNSDFAAVFGDLKAGLESPLNGMGIAFSSSLFGLASSLVLGFLELTAGQAQNRFYNDLEEWLSNYTRLSSNISATDGESSVPVYVQALLEQTADSLENLQRILARNEDARVSSQGAVMALSEKLATLSDRMQGEQEVLGRLADGQDSMQQTLQRFAASAEKQSSAGMDEASRNHLRNLDVYVTRLLDEIAEGRNQTVGEIRSEIKLLARTMAAVADDRRKAGGD